MKRLLVSLCCVALLTGVVPLLIAADETEPPTTSATSSSTGTETIPTTEPTGSTDPTESTDPTGATDPTEPPPDFTYSEYNRIYDEESGILSVIWNYAQGGGADVIAVVVDGREYAVSGSMGRFSVDLGQLSAGSHTLAYVFRMPDGTTRTEQMEPLMRSTTEALTLSMDVQPGAVTAVLTNSAGQAVADYPLQFILNLATTLNYTTDSNGRVYFTVSGTLTSVSCIAPARTIGAVTYTGASASWQSSGGGVTAAEPSDDGEDDWTTTTRSRWSATQTTRTTGTVRTYKTIQGAGTTSTEGAQIAVNATFDEGVVEAFGLTNDDFNQRARLLMDAELYSSLVGNTKATVMMTLGYNPFEITDQHISELVSGKSRYSRYTDIKRVAVTMGLQFVDENQQIVPIEIAPEGSYTVRLPVPESMVDCPVLAVAIIEKDGLSHLIDVQVKNGYMEFVTNGFTSIAVLGFGDHAVRTGGGVAWQLIVLLVVGVLMLTAAGLLMYFFVWRKPKPAAQAAGEQAAADQPQGETGPADLPGEGGEQSVVDQIVSEREGTTGGEKQIQPPEDDDGYDLYSSDSRRPRP